MTAVAGGKVLKCEKGFNDDLNDYYSNKQFSSISKVLSYYEWMKDKFRRSYVYIYDCFHFFECLSRK